MSRQHSFFESNKPILLVAGGSTTATSNRISPFTDGFNRCAIILVARAVGTSLDMKLIQADAASGGTTKDVHDAAGADVAITQLVAADDEVMASIDIGPDALDGDGGFTHLAVTVTADGTCDWDVIAIPYDARYPGSFAHDDTYLTAKSVEFKTRSTTL